MLKTIGKLISGLLLALLAILGVGIAVVVTRKRSQVATQGTSDFRHPDRSVPWWADASMAVDRSVGWYRLPLLFGLGVLYGVRRVLQAQNPYDTSTLPTIPQPQPQAQDRSYLTSRTVDGTFNDLHYPTMGSAGARFGRLVPLEQPYPEPEP